MRILFIIDHAIEALGNGFESIQVVQVADQYAIAAEMASGSQRIIGVGIGHTTESEKNARLAMRAIATAVRRAAVKCEDDTFSVVAVDLSALLASYRKKSTNSNADPVWKTWVLDQAEQIDQDLEEMIGKTVSEADIKHGVLSIHLS